MGRSACTPCGHVAGPEVEPEPEAEAGSTPPALREKMIKGKKILRSLEEKILQFHLVWILSSSSKQLQKCIKQQEHQVQPAHKSST